MREKYKVVIVGAGPAGLFAAYELVNRGIENIAIVEKGKKVSERKPEDVMYGVGGAGLFSDGKLNFTPKRFKTDLMEFLPLPEAEKLIDEIEKIFDKFGVDEPSSPSDLKKAEELRSSAQKMGLNLLLIKEKHLGSDKLPKYIGNFEKYLEEKRVEFLIEKEVEEVLVSERTVKGIKLTSGEEILAEKVILCPGRGGNSWLTKELKTLGILMEQKGIEIGVRVEVQEEILKSITSILYDPPIFLRTESFDDLVETFCTNPGGFVAVENYKDFVCVNGHSRKDSHSKNSNFALLVKINLTEPVTDTLAYGEDICRLANCIGGGKPLLQRYADFRRYHRSTWERLSKSDTEPTLKEVTPGDISMALPYRIVTDLSEALERINKLIPGLTNDSTLLYAPEVKFFSVRPKVNKSLETGIKGLFVAGDGAGVSGNIVGAAATGMIAARGIVQK